MGTHFKHSRDHGRVCPNANTRSVMAALGCLLLLDTGTPALADTGGEQAIQEVVVTARQQSESLQKVPVAVAAIAGAELARFQLDKPEDVAGRIPTLNVSCCGSGSGAQVSLRGVGSSYLSAAFDSAVALDFDSVVVSSMRVLQSGFFDMQQVEVLKGPQSLYFGKSASAGVLSFKSADPTDRWEYGGKASYEFEQRGYSGEAYVSGPLTETLGLRVAGKYNDVKEVLHNSAPGVAHPNRGEKNANVRATMQWRPSDSFSVNLKLNYVRHTADGAIRNSVVGCGLNGVPDPVSLAGGAFLIPGGYNCDISGHRYVLPDIAPALAAKAPLGKDFNNGAPYAKSDIYFGRLKFDWKLSDQVTFSSITGYLDQKSVDFDAFSYGGVLGGASFGTGAGLSYNNLRQFTEEARLSSSFSGPLNFMLGAFYEKRHIEYNAAQNGINIAVLAGPDPVTGYTSDWFKEHLTHTDAVSAFGSVNYDITSRLKLSGGVRWTHEKKDQLISIPYDSIILSSVYGFAPSGFIADRIKYKDSNVSPEVSLSYQPAKDVNLYAAYKKGYKSGGIDNSALPSNALIGLSSTNATVRAQTAAALIYKAETAKGGEFGAKTQWLGHKLTLNASIYDYTFNNLQIQIFDGQAVQFRTTNAGELTSKGADLDFRWVTNLPGLTLYGALAYTDAKYTKSFVPDPQNAPLANLKGRPSSGAPKWSGNIAANFHTLVDGHHAFDLTGNVQYKGSYYTRDGSLVDYVQPATTTFDLAASIGSEDGRWTLSLIGTNLGDKYAVTSSEPRPFQSPTGDDLLLNLNEGRKVFIQVGFKF